MTYDFLYDLHDGIATITLNRPDKLNALTFNVYAQLRDLMESLREDDEVKVVIITGEGKGFCSGGDVDEIIGELFQRDVKAHLEFARMTGALYQLQNVARVRHQSWAAIRGNAVVRRARFADDRDMTEVGHTESQEHMRAR